MIVKDEAPVIERCLLSVIPYIEDYIICDTGSSDNTVDVILETMRKAAIPGSIYNDKWENFGHNRSLALERYTGDGWVLMIDADDSIIGTLPTNQIQDDCDAYFVNLYQGSTSWKRLQIFNFKRKIWKYLEPVHEFPDCDGDFKSGELVGEYRWEARCEGNRSKLSANIYEKYYKDYKLLKSFLIKNSQDTRKQFYAAQSAFDAGLYQIAEHEYSLRIKLEGWYEEVFYSWYRIGRCREALKRPDVDIIDAYMKAYEVNPFRVEPLYALSCYLRNKGRPKLAHLIASYGLNTLIPKDSLFIEEHCYSWGIKDEVASTAFYVDNFKLGLSLSKELLKEPSVPEGQKDRIKNNIKIYENQLK
jgi:glycosyltransferase involved in cell wall biosynthesis